MMNQAVKEHRETERLIKELPQSMERMEIRLPNKIYTIDAAKRRQRKIKRKYSSKANIKELIAIEAAISQTSVRLYELTIRKMELESKTRPKLTKVK